MDSNETIVGTYAIVYHDGNYYTAIGAFKSQKEAAAQLATHELQQRAIQNEMAGAVDRMIAAIDYVQNDGRPRDTVTFGAVRLLGNTHSPDGLSRMVLAELRDHELGARVVINFDGVRCTSQLWIGAGQKFSATELVWLSALVEAAAAVANKAEEPAP